LIVLRTKEGRKAISDTKGFNLSYDPGQLRDLVIRPCLKAIDQIIPYSETAVELMMLTAAQESFLGRALKQYGGPAMGLYQIEPNTHHDIWQNFLAYHKVDIETVSAKAGWKITEPKDRWLFSNLDYATIVARIKYRMYKDPLPVIGDTTTMTGPAITAIAQYWKKAWNTPLGKGTVEEACKNYRRYVMSI
jgi:hypothetical protein